MRPLQLIKQYQGQLFKRSLASYSVKQNGVLKHFHFAKLTLLWKRRLKL